MIATRGPGSRRTLAVVLFFVCAPSLGAASALAASPGDHVDPLASARLLFAEALRDEENGKYAEALEKFLRVEKVRDTAAIEYRIGSCEEALGRAAAAYTAYRDAIALGQGDSLNDDIMRSALERLDALGPRVARFRVIAANDAPADLDVRLDGVAVGHDARAAPIALEPGAHVLTAAAAGAVPFRTDIFLSAGMQTSVTVPTRSFSTPSLASPPPATPRHSAGHSAGLVLIGLGAAMGVTAVALFVAREEDIASLGRACPRAVCPSGVDVNGLESTRNRALLEGPLGAAFAAAGLLSGGVGTYFAFFAGDSRRTSPVSVALTASPGLWGLRAQGSFR